MYESEIRKIFIALVIIRKKLQTAILILGKAHLYNGRKLTKP